MCMYVHIYMYVYIYIHIYIYKHRGRTGEHAQPKNSNRERTPQSYNASCDVPNASEHAHRTRPTHIMLGNSCDTVCDTINASEHARMTSPTYIIHGNVCDPACLWCFTVCGTNVALQRTGTMHTHARMVLQSAYMEGGRPSSSSNSRRYR